MTIEAPYCRYKKNNLKIFIVVLVICAIWFGYDGRFNKQFIEKHTDANGTPDSTLSFNQKSPPFFIGAAALLGVYLFGMRNKKVIADENTLIIGKKSIAYNSIEKINKTYFESKGYFVITHRDQQGNKTQLKLSNKKHDNLAAILDKLIAKIS